MFCSIRNLATCFLFTRDRALFSSNFNDSFFTGRNVCALLPDEIDFGDTAAEVTTSAYAYRSNLDA